MRSFLRVFHVLRLSWARILLGSMFVWSFPTGITTHNQFQRKVTFILAKELNIMEPGNKVYVIRNKTFRSACINNFPWLLGGKITCQTSTKLFIIPRYSLQTLRNKSQILYLVSDVYILIGCVAHKCQVFPQYEFRGPRMDHQSCWTRNGIVSKPFFTPFDLVPHQQTAFHQEIPNTWGCNVLHHPAIYCVKKCSATSITTSVYLGFLLLNVLEQQRLFLSSLPNLRAVWNVT